VTLRFYALLPYSLDTSTVDSVSPVSERSCLSLRERDRDRISLRRLRGMLYVSYKLYIEFLDIEFPNSELPSLSIHYSYTVPHGHAYTPWRILSGVHLVYV
jgi:hypothetical protein